MTVGLVKKGETFCNGRAFYVQFSQLCLVESAIIRSMYGGLTGGVSLRYVCNCWPMGKNEHICTNILYICTYVCVCVYVRMDVSNAVQAVSRGGGGGGGGSINNVL